MTDLIHLYADRLNFGVHDLCHPKMYLIKKYLIIKRLTQDYPALQVMAAFGYNSPQSVYSAVRNVNDWMHVDGEIKEMWGRLCLQYSQLK